MNTPPDIEALARTRLAADEERITGSRRAYASGLVADEW